MLLRCRGAFLRWHGSSGAEQVCKELSFTRTPACAPCEPCCLPLTQARHGVGNGARTGAVQDANGHHLGVLGHSDLQADGGGGNVRACIWGRGAATVGRWAGDSVNRCTQELECMLKSNMQH